MINPSVNVILAPHVLIDLYATLWHRDRLGRYAPNVVIVPDKRRVHFPADLLDGCDNVEPVLSSSSRYLEVGHGA